MMFKFKNWFIVYADDDGSDIDTGSGNGGEETKKRPAANVNFEQLIEQARKEEKSKLYPQIKKLEGDNKKLTESLNEALLRESALKKAYEEMKNDPEKDKELKDLRKKVEKLEKDLQAAKDEVPKAEEIRKEIEAEYTLKEYIRIRLKDAGDSILPMLHETITGKSEKEVDEAIEKAKEKTLKVKMELGIIDKDGKEIEQKKAEPEKDTTRKQKPPAVNPVQSGGKRNPTPTDVRKMSLEEYKEYRKELGLK